MLNLNQEKYLHKLYNEINSKENVKSSDMYSLFICLSSNNLNIVNDASIKINNKIKQSNKSTFLNKVSKLFTERTFSTVYWYDSWTKLPLNRFTHAANTEDELINILGLCTFVCNGYFRERALKELIKIKSVKALPYILIATNDYVEVVRNRAKKALFRMLSPENFTSIIKIYSLIEMSKHWKHSIYDEIESQLDIVVNYFDKDRIVDSIKYADGNGKVFCYNMLAGKKYFSNIEVCNMLLAEKEIKAKNKGLYLLINNLSSAELFDYKDKLLTVKNPNIRAKTIDRLYTDGFINNQSDLEFTLMDAYSKVRFTGVYYLCKINDFDFSSYYRNILKEEPNNIIAIHGLCEQGNDSDYEIIKCYLNDTRVSVIKKVLDFIARKESSGFIDTLTKCLNDSRIGVSNKARRLLFEHRMDINADVVYQTYLNSECLHVKHNCMILLCNLKKWNSICYIIEFCSHKDYDISHFARFSYEKWYYKFNKSFVSPTEKQTRRIKKYISKYINSIKNNDEYLNEMKKHISFLLKP